PTPMQRSRASARGPRGRPGGRPGSMGLSYAALGEPRHAIELHEQWLTVAREIGDRRGEAIASWNLGAVHEELDELAKAVALMQAYVDFLRGIGHPDAEPRAAHVD